MDKSYWNRIGKNYSREIFHALHSDRKGCLRRLLNRLAGPDKDVIDFGCGTGQFLPLLAEKCRYVRALDFSAGLLEQAAARHRRFGNIEFYNVDLSLPRLKFEAAAWGLCVNVLIMENFSLRRRILQTIRRCLLPGGRLLLVLPSLESVFLTQQRLIEWNLRDGFTPRRAAEARIPGLSRRALDRVHEGIFPVDGVPTKHYLKEELELFLSSGGFEMESIEKVEYGWETEFAGPPRWMKSPYPWDWAVVARKSLSKK
ncbi:MAG: class I SAM-dependent methyltransferase [Methylacidiphilales bacterium]|nr:class I SAM-dependent methyltransferase [Candidatus Methylacidiphilales bacterium]